MSDGVHLLIPFAFCGAQDCAQALATLSLPRLEKLLARLAPVRTDAGDEHTLSMPHERALALEYGLDVPDGEIPWAAWQVAQAGRNPQGAAWAWITPCHWRVGTDHIVMGHPQELRLDAGQSQAFLAAMQPFFAQDGIELEYESPTRWTARGEIFRGLATASLDRVAGRTIDPWIPRAPQARTLRRLQQEMQMLLYTHELNEERIRGGLLPVNSFWVSGTGALPAAGAPGAPPDGLKITHVLRDAALADDWNGWTAAWQHLDATQLQVLDAALEAGDTVKLTLCGERNARSWSRQGRGGWTARLGSLFGRPKTAEILQAL
jgi:hypothetical protein